MLTITANNLLTTLYRIVLGKLQGNLFFILFRKVRKTATTVCVFYSFSLSIKHNIYDVNLKSCSHIKLPTKHFRKIKNAAKVMMEKKNLVQMITNKNKTKEKSGTKLWVVTLAGFQMKRTLNVEIE